MLNSVKDKWSDVQDMQAINDVWFDETIQSYFPDNFVNLPSKQLDREFNNDMRILVSAIIKLPEQDRKGLIEVLSKIIESYLENMIVKELEFSFHKLLRL